MISRRTIIPLATVAIATLANPSAQAAPLAYEGFDYTPGETFLGANGGLGFSQAWQANSTHVNNALTKAGSLSYTDSFGNTLLTSGGRGFFTGNGTATGDNTGGSTGNAQPFRGLTTTRGYGTDPATTWVSFLAVRTGNAFAYSDVGGSVSYGRAAGLQFFNTNAEQLTAGRASQNTETDSGLPNDTWALYNRGAAAQTVASAHPLTDLVFVTLRIDHLTGANNPGNDVAYMWLNHDNLTVEPNIGSALQISASQFASSDRDYNFNRIRLFGGSDNATVGYGSMEIDEIRIGESFADVAPIVPEPTALAIGGLGLLAASFRWRKS